MKNKNLLVVLFASLLLVFSACQQKSGDQNPEGAGMNADTTASARNTAADENEFINKAASGGMMEVELGRYAVKNAGSKDVRDFGQRMVTDHSKANAELKALAKTKNITLPDSMMDKHRDMASDLMKLKGAEFDKEYMSKMVKDHEEDVSEFEDASKDHADPDVKAWAAKTAPVLRQHLEMAKKIDEKMNR